MRSVSNGPATELELAAMLLETAIDELLSSDELTAMLEELATKDELCIDDASLETEELTATSDDAVAELLLLSTATQAAKDELAVAISAKRPRLRSDNFADGLMLLTIIVPS